MNIKNIRTWNVEDRLAETHIVDYWRESLELDGDRMVPFEIELFYRHAEEKRQKAENLVKIEIEKLGGQVLNRSHIASISYHALLVQLPRNKIETLITQYEDIALMHVV